MDSNLVASNQWMECKGDERWEHVTADNGSVTSWFGLLQAHHDQAAQRLWERYFPRLLEITRHKMQGIPTQTADEEDLALSAFHTFCQAARGGRIPSVANRDDLWRTLVLITAGKVVDRRRYLGSDKRGGDSHRIVHQVADLEEAIAQEPDPAFVVQLAEELDSLFGRLSDNNLRDTARAKLEGYTIEEIAERLGCSTRTVRRRLTVIRRTWEEASGRQTLTT